jgi:nitroreductase
MEFADVVRRRRMVRAYDPSLKVSDQTLAAVIRSALRAPTAGFTQGVSLLVLDTVDDRSRFWRLTSKPSERSAWLRGMSTAPVLLLVWTSRDAYLDRYAEPDKGWTDRDENRWSAPYWFVDGGMAAMSALLAAVDGGLAACFFGVPPDRVDAVREAFGVPAEQLSVGVVSLGYPDPAAVRSGSAARRRRRDPAVLVHRGRWHPVGSTGTAHEPS